MYCCHARCQSFKISFFNVVQFQFQNIQFQNINQSKDHFFLSSNKRN